MKKTHAAIAALASVAIGSVAFIAVAAAPAAKPPLGFFLTSKTPSGTGNLGGFAGADKTCQDLAASVGAGARTWHAYLSGYVNGRVAVNARDRIGAGPWYNAKGDLIASNVADLHGDFARDRANLSKATILNEKGEVNSEDSHDLLTGSNYDGRVISIVGLNATCANWTSDKDTDLAIVAHSDRTDGNSSWNSTHMSHGCSAPKLKESSSYGQFYCFAVN